MPVKFAPGDIVSVEITVGSRAAASNLLLSFSAGESLSLASPAFVYLGTCKAGDAFTETVSVISAENGLKYLNVFVSGMFGERNMSRSAAVPVPCGSNPQPTLKKTGTPATDFQGRKIIIMPAEENK